MRDGTLIGTVGVSGLPDVEDHQLIVDALQELLTKKYRARTIKRSKISTS
ncbi:heme-binding protein [Rhizobium rhizogenes]|nr:heme-binding protein [Rhizobium rhizogenes]